MTSLAALLAEPEQSLYERPIFPVEAPDGRRDWSEIDRQATFRKHLRVVAPSLIVFANANAGKRNPFKAKKEGIVGGVFDLTVTNGEIGRQFTAYPEMKGYRQRRAGKLSQAQIDWGNKMFRAGHHVACFFDPYAAIEWIRGIAPEAFIDRVGRL